MFDALINKYASLAFVVLGSGLSIMALRAVKRWVFWLLLLIAIPCLLIAGVIYWYAINFTGERADENFQAALKVGMTESDVMQAVEKYYPRKGPNRPTVLQNGTERLGVFIPGGESSREKMIHLRFENGRVAEVTGN
jgi:hypothetical protein